MTAHLLAALLSSALAADAPPPPTQVVEVTKEAAVTNGDEGAAIEQAKEAALREAVSQVAGTLVSSDTFTEGNILVSDRIYSHAAGYVKKWSYVGKPSVADGTATVKIRAEVSAAQLDKDLEAVRALLDRKNKPRTVILIAEQNVGSTQPFAWWSQGPEGRSGRERRQRRRHGVDEPRHLRERLHGRAPEVRLELRRPQRAGGQAQGRQGGDHRAHRR